MKTNRRTWLKIVLNSPWLPLFIGRSAAAQENEEDRLSHNVLLLVDTLVPTDDQAPGAVDLGIHKVIETSMRAHTGYQELLVNGLAWLDIQSQDRYQAKFSNLPEQARVTLLSAAEKSPRGTPQHHLFTVLRQDVLQRFYSHADSWPQLGYQGPPQPLGFINYSKPPAASDG